jgi:hypothetical protein
MNDGVLELQSVVYLGQGSIPVLDSSGSSSREERRERGNYGWKEKKE